MTNNYYTDDVTAAIEAAWPKPLDVSTARAIVAAVAPAIAARALREAADDADEFRAFTYGPEMFVRPTKDEYAAINEVLGREFGHGTDRIAADCMDRAIALQAERLRARAEEINNG